MLIIIALLTASSVGLFLFIEHSSWGLISSKKSPDQSYILHHYKYYSDSNRHAPYGDYVFLGSKYSRKPGKKGHVVFAGYCRNSLTYFWENDKEVNVICKIQDTKDIRTYSAKVFGITINVQTE